MANVCSLCNKTDKLEASVYHMHEYRTASILAYTETWLNSNDDDDTPHINGFAPPLRLDRDRKLTGKKHSGGVCLYVNTGWCSTVIVREKLCTTDIKLLAVSLRPFYLPKEFPQHFLILVYIHPRANATTATEHITSTLYKIVQLSPDSPKFILGDFNHCCPDMFIKVFQQYVKCTSRMVKILDKCYGSVPDAYRALTLPPLGSAPAYTPVVRSTKVT